MGTLFSRRTPRACFAAMAAAVLVAAGCGGDDETTTPSGGSGSGNGTTKITVATLPITSNAVIQLAQDKGWFGEENLEVETITVPNPAAVVAAVQGGQAQFGYAPSIALLNAASQGVDVKVVAPADGTNPEAQAEIEGGASPGEYDDTAVVAGADSGIASASDLAGRTVAVPARKAQMEVTIAKAVADDGGDPAQIKWIALGFPEMQAALQAGRVDAIGTVTPFTGQATSNGGKAIAYPALALFPEGAVGMWFGSGEYVGAESGVVSGFRAVVERANAFANENLDEVFKIAATTTQTPIDVLQNAAQPYWPAEVTAEDITRAADAMVELGYLQSAPDAASLLAS